MRFSVEEQIKQMGPQMIQIARYADKQPGAGERAFHTKGTKDSQRARNKENVIVVTISIVTVWEVRVWGGGVRLHPLICANLEEWGLAEAWREGI